MATGSPMAFSSSAVVALLLLLIAPPTDGATALFGGCEGACVENATQTCDEIVLTNDFSTDGCCFSLAENMDGGCLITVQGDGGFCFRTERKTYCSVADEIGEFFCVAGTQLTYEMDTSSTATTNSSNCPESDFDIETTSETEILPTQTMTLTTGASTWTNQDTTDWVAVTVAHTQEFFMEYPELGFTDVLTDIQVYPVGGATFDNVTAEATLIYYQFVSYRVSSDHSNATHLVNATGADMLDIAFSTPAGSESYLAKLQASGNPTLATITDVSDYGPFSPPTTVDGDQPGGAGRPDVTTHESQKTDAPEEEGPPAVVALQASSAGMWGLTLSGFASLGLFSLLATW
ncbi:expressed unknown protein [Seminavis robusta]|uniref:Uncharacterized protein n=1 Tax=Seminavis robusta TaxID=568900 RepID=A0A9N8HYP4_9STRA|nr:expressed unknown protein [Seminavis robusta]|eukprot:Sro2042_g312280.1 n/a (347) ;mRNA; f:3292-4332